MTLLRVFRLVMFRENTIGKWFMNTYVSFFCFVFSFPLIQENQFLMLKQENQLSISPSSVLALPIYSNVVNTKHHAVRFIQENVIQQSCGTLNPLLLTLTNIIKMSSKDLGIKNQDIRLAERFLDTTIRQFHFHLPFVHVNYLLTVDIEIKFT